MNFLSTYAALRLSGTAPRRPSFTASLFRAFGYMFIATCLLPVQIIKSLNDLHAAVRSHQPPPDPPPFRGHHPRTGVPLRNLADSLDDLDQDTN